MPTDNDVFVIDARTFESPLTPRKPKRKSKPRKPKLKTGIVRGVRMDIEELNELKDAELRKDTRSDIFLGEDIDKFQKQSIHDQRKVYVRAHTKRGKDGKIIVVKPYLRDK